MIRFRKLLCLFGHYPACWHRAKGRKGPLRGYAAGGGFCSAACERCRNCGQSLRWDGKTWVPK